MSPEFSAAFDPALTEILQLADRARSGTAGPADEEQARVRGAIDRGAGRLTGVRGKDWELASYALASLADDLFIAGIDWNGRRWWTDHALEVAMFNTRDRATKFFEGAEQAAGLASRDAIEAHVLAVVLGFRGKHRDRPDDLAAWLRRQEQLFKVGQGRTSLPDGPVELSGAPPLSGHLELIWASLFTAFSLACGVVAVAATLRSAAR